MTFEQTMKCSDYITEIEYATQIYGQMIIRHIPEMVVSLILRNQNKVDTSETQYKTSSPVVKKSYLPNRSESTCFK